MSNNHQDGRNDHYRIPSQDPLVHLETPPTPSHGPELYHARRAAWIAPKATSHQPPSDTSPPAESQFTERLEQLLSGPEDTWNNSLETVWNGLSRGNRLRHSLPLSTVVRIIHRAWIHDKTWPVGAVAAADTDDNNVLPAQTSMYQSFTGSSQQIMAKDARSPQDI